MNTLRSVPCQICLKELILGSLSPLICSQLHCAVELQKMEEEGGEDFRRWDELIPDALGLIFRNLSLNELLTVVPGVCKSWAKAVAGPYCWEEIDIEEWSRRCHPNHIDRMLKMLVTRSGVSLRKLTVSGLGQRDSNIFSFIAEHAISLRTLRLPRSEITDLVVEQIAWRLPMVTFLDLSYCNTIGAQALAIIGKNCKMLSSLCRNTTLTDSLEKSSPEDEAHAIASTMPRLKHLEIAHQLINTGSLLEILSSCPDLEFLYLRGCWNVELGPQFFKERHPKLRVLGPVVMEVMDRYEEANNCPWEDCPDILNISDIWELQCGDMWDFLEDDGIFNEM